MSTPTEPAPGGSPPPPRTPHAPLLALTAVAAGADAVSYLGLGRVFPANMTGNTVLLAIALATAGASEAARSAVALGGFVLGAAISGAVPGRGRWGRAATARLAVELAVLAAAGALWAVLGQHPHGPVRYAVIALVAMAMGMQSATVAGLGVGVSTTYITGTWTAVSTWTARRLRGAAPPTRTHRLQFAVLACYLAAAFAAASAFHHTGW